MNTHIKAKMAFEGIRFTKAQINAIDKSKYIESEKVRKDLFYDEHGNPSQNFYIWWIKNHAENFRKAWYTSSCRRCSKVDSCKECLKDLCLHFEPDIDLDGNVKERL